MLFADDSNTNEDLNDVANLFKLSKLSLNIKKTNFMVFTKRKKSPMLFLISEELPLVK